MKKICKTFVAFSCLILAFALALAGCNSAKVEKISLSKTSLNLIVGNSETLTATITPDEAKDEAITWSSSDEKVATVASGKVTAVAAGEATVTAKAGDREASCTVKVSATQPVKALSADMISLSGDSFPFTGKDITPTVTVTNGETTIDASYYDVKYENNFKKGTATVTVTAKSGNTVISGNASKKFGITATASEVSADDFSVNLKASAAAGDTAKQIPDVRYIKDGATYKLETSEYEVKYYNGDTELSDAAIKELTSGTVTVKVTIRKDGNFTLASADANGLVLADRSYAITIAFLDGATFALNTPNQAAMLGEVAYHNPKNGTAPALTLTKTGGNVFSLKGTPATFGAEGESGKPSQATAFGGVGARDSFVVLTLNNPEKKEVTMGWVEKNSKGAFDTSLSSSNPGYKRLQSGTEDVDLILWLNRPDRTDYFCIKVGDEVGILDVSAAKIAQFFTVEDKKVDVNGREVTADAGFENAKKDNKIDLAITKQLGANNGADVDVYEVTGTAQSFTKANAAAFTEEKNVDENHRYIAFRVNQPEGEKYKSGWVSDPKEKLPGDAYDKTIEKAGDVLDIERILWVTRPQTAGKNFYKIEVENGRSYVLDISMLNTGNDILSVDNGRYDKNGEEVDAMGYHNEHDVEISAEGNVSEITGSATKFTRGNSGENWDSEGENRPEADTDGYLVLQVKLPADESAIWKYGWVKDPYTDLDADTAADGNANGKLILWVTGEETSGRYLRIEVNYGEGENGVKRAYVYDLGKLLLEDEDEENIREFFKVENEEVKMEGLGDYTFRNASDSGLKIEHVKGEENYWKITGRATQFNDENKAAYPNDIFGDGKNYGYILFRINAREEGGDPNKKVKVTSGWIEEEDVGKDLDLDDSDVLDSKSTVDSCEWDKLMLMLVNRPDRTRNIWCVVVEDENGKTYYYLDFSEISTDASDFCDDETGKA